MQLATLGIDIGKTWFYVVRNSVSCLHDVHQEYARARTLDTSGHCIATAADQ
jgi:hypothetical protein